MWVITFFRAWMPFGHKLTTYNGLDRTRKFRRSPLCKSSRTIITLQGMRFELRWHISQIYVLTGFPRVTTPWRLTTLRCWNWPLMAASCRNLTSSFSPIPSFSVLMATGITPTGDCHRPLSTLPNWPDPKCSVILHVQRKCKDLCISVCTKHFNSHCICCLSISLYLFLASCS